jgi:hypothetical protein
LVRNWTYGRVVLYLLGGGRKELINSSLSNSTAYHMSMFLIPKTNLEMMDKMRRIFFGKGAVLRKNMICSNGPRSAELRKKEGWA